MRGSVARRSGACGISSRSGTSTVFVENLWMPLSKEAKDAYAPGLHTLAAAVRSASTRLLDRDLPCPPSGLRRARRPIHAFELPATEEDDSLQHLPPDEPDLFPVDPRFFEHLRDHAARTPGLRLTSHGPPSRQNRPSADGRRRPPPEGGAPRGSAGAGRGGAGCPPAPPAPRHGSRPGSGPSPRRAGG